MSELSSNQNSNVTEEDSKQSQKLTGSRKGRFFFKKQKCDTNPSADKQKTANNIGSDDNPSECSHQIIIKDMCGTCGKDLRIRGGFSGERIEPSVANVSMIHHVPELVVSNEIANELGARDHQNVLHQRKLILLVDLDQTLVHTSNRPPKPNEAGATDMFGYQIYGATFFTKIRPYTRHFLEALNKLYEMHIVTYGQRIYAHKIAELLDPNKVYFGYRILSRDELLSSMHKTGNLKALFPCSEQLVVMLDDRPDVWMHSEALIRVKPYRFFTEIGDINAPTEQELQQIKDPAVNKCLKDEENKVQSALDKQAEANDKIPIQHDKIKDSSDSEIVDVDKERGLEARTDNKSSDDDLSLPFPQLQDEDCALEHIERILSEVHSLFYQQYDRDNSDESKKENVPDVKRIVAWLRSQVLAGERIVFSGIVPIGIDIRNCEIHRLCTKFGAIVEDKIVEGQTTVLVAARAFTEKTRQARNLKIPVVSTRWLDACFERWQKVDKSDFLFDEEESLLATSADEKPSIETAQRGIASGKRVSHDDLSAASLSNKRSRHSESLCLDEETDHFGQMDTLDKRALHEMEDEVTNALLEEDDSTDDDEEDE